MSYLILQILNHFNNLHWTIIYLAFCIIALEILTKINFYTNLAANIFTFLILGHRCNRSMPAHTSWIFSHREIMPWFTPSNASHTSCTNRGIRLLAGFVIKPNITIHLFNKKTGL